MIPDIEKFLPVAIFKMATTILHKFNIVQFQRPELIPDIEKFTCFLSWIYIINHNKTNHSSDKPQTSEYKNNKISL
jgi:uncharacterized membrane protein